MALVGPNIYPSIPSFPYIAPCCKVCGAELNDEELHKQWHEGLEEQLRQIAWKADR